MAKRGPERAIDTRQYDLLRPNVGQKEPPRVGSTICNSQELARKSHRDSAVRFVTAKCGLERATETRQYDLLRPTVGQKEPPRLGSTICYRHGSTICGQMWARKSHQDSAARFVAVKRGPERATKTRQYDLLRPRLGQKEPPRLGSTICYGQTWARKSHRDSAARLVTTKSWPERVTKTRQYDLLRPNMGQKEPPRLGSTVCYGQELATKTRQYGFLRSKVGQKEPPRLVSTICYSQEWARKRHQDSARRFVTAKSWTERATVTPQYDLLAPRVGQKEPPRDSAIELARKSQRYLAVRFVTAKSWLERGTARLGSMICYGQELARKSHRDSAVRFVMAKRGPERATEIRQYDLLRPRFGQKEASRLGSTICFSQDLTRKSHQDSAVRLVTVKRWPEQKKPPRLGQKEPPRLGNTICYGQIWARKSHQDSAVRFVTTKRGPERATETRQYDLLRPGVGQKEPPRLGSTI